MTRPWICLVAIVALSIQVRCQFSNPNLVCLTANDAGSPPGSLIQIPLTVGGHVDVEFSVNTSFTIDGFDFFVVTTSGNITGYPNASLHQVTGGVFGPALRSGTTSSPLGDGWMTLQMQSITLIGSVTYGIRMLPNVGSWGAWLIGADPAGSTPLPYTVTCGNIGVYPPCATYTTPGAAPVMLRFRDASCGPGASSMPLGIDSGAFIFADRPVLGTTVHLSAGSFAATGGAIYVFWSLGANPAGSPIGTTGFLTYLDLPSLYALTGAGLEPLCYAPLFWIGANWYIPIPNDPALAGLIVGLQAMAVHAGYFSGGYPIGGNVYIAVSSGIQVTVGY